MLYIYVIQNRSRSSEAYDRYFTAATRCQSHIAAVAEKGSLSERYCLLLEELRVESLRQTGRMYTPLLTPGGTGVYDQGTNFQDISISGNGQFDSAEQYPVMMGNAPMDFEELPGSVVSDYSGWAQFASMVSSGLGNLDNFLNDDPFAL